MTKVLVVTQANKATFLESMQIAIDEGSQKDVFEMLVTARPTVCDENMRIAIRKMIVDAGMIVRESENCRTVEIGTYNRNASNTVSKCVDDQVLRAA